MWYINMELIKVLLIWNIMKIKVSEFGSEKLKEDQIRHRSCLL